ncbi:MAG: phosphoribosylformylglycinamidine cyclo-ligase [bacterium]
MIRSVDYRSTGVDQKAALQALRRIAPLLESTRTAQVVGDMGLFAGVFRLPVGKQHPVLLASSDCIGTKLIIASLARKFDTVGADLVHHCINDLICGGGEPLFFLDYIACGRLDPGVVAEIVSGIAQSCQRLGIALLGGETAELPNLLKPDSFDLSGTIIGWADEADLISGRDIRPGDVIIGLPAIGLHTNGYSLARTVLLDQSGLKLHDYLPELGCTLGEELLRVHPCYLPAVRELRSRINLKGIAHITGGGIEGNLRRILPPHCQAQVDYGAWRVPPIFDLIQRRGPVELEEMRRVFNLGVGMALVVSELDAEKIVSRKVAKSQRSKTHSDRNVESGIEQGRPFQIGRII